MDDLSFLIVSRDRPVELRRCLESLKNEKPEFKVRVIDNNSSPGAYDELKRDFPEVEFHFSPVNLDISAGRNLGIKLAKSRLCFVLDDDTTLSAFGAAEIALSYFESEPLLAVVSCRVLNPSDGKEDYAACPRRDKNFLDFDYPAGFFSGCAYVCRIKHIEDAGEFWPIIVQAEELDLAYRLYDKGYKIIRSSKLNVYHHRELSLAKRLSWIERQTGNRALVAVRNLPLHLAISQSLVWWSYLLVTCRSWAEIKSFLKGLRKSCSFFPEALKLRKPISRENLCLLNSISGRVWY